MKRILGKTRSKLRSKKGETLVGILVAILIIALAAGIFAAMYTASMNINLSAREQDKAFYEAVSTLERMEKSDKTTTTPDGQLQYKSEKYKDTVDVEYLTQDGLSVYRNRSGNSKESGE